MAFSMPTSCVKFVRHCCKMFFETIVLLMTMTIDGLQRVSPQGSYTDNYIKIKSMMNKTFFSITFKTKNELFRTSLATKIQDKFVTKK